MRLSLAFLALAILALGGCTCSDTVSQTRFACKDTSECLTGFVCRGGECRAEDIPTGTCFEGETKPCSMSGCQSACGTDAGWQACSPATGPGFDSNPANCGACGITCSTRLTGLTCIAGRCSCVLDSDCPTGDLCGPGGVCVMATDPCAKLACDAGTVCRDGTCGPVGCALGCKAGEVCNTVTNECRPFVACHFATACADGGVCEGGPLPDGESCDDGIACTASDQCALGVCTGTAYACPAPTQCQQAVACAGDGGCDIVPMLDGTACDDGVACTFSDSCVSGQCSGTTYTCTADQCSSSSTCDGDGGCLTTPRNVGSICDDNQPCSFDDLCTDAGVCAGTSYSCPGVTACKEAGVCLGDGGCDVVNKANGTTCDDSLACTTNDSCTNGTCGGTAVTSFRDVDGDGRGSNSATQQVCPLNSGYVLDGGDCDDTSALVFDNVPATIDVDRDGVTTSTTLNPLACVGVGQTFSGRTYFQATDAGFPWLGVASAGADCNDADPDVFTSRAMVALDADRDGYTTGGTVTACTGASSVVNGRTYYANTSGAFVYLDVSAALGTDCSDADADVFTTRSVARDVDHDGFTTTTTTSSQCTGASSVFNTRTYYADTTGTAVWLATASMAADCDDANATVTGTTNYYADTDGDSFGAGAATPRCGPLAGLVLNNTDCNDTDGDVFTTRTVATDVDHDAFTTTTTTSSQCTGAPSVFNTRTYYADTSGAFTWLATASSVTDCNDANASVTGPVSWYPDVDGDTFGASNSGGTVRCAAVGQEVTNNTDCNDGTTLEYRLVTVALDRDQDGYSVAAATSTCVGAQSTINTRTYYYQVAAGGSFYLLGTQLLGTSDCDPNNTQLVAGQNNLLQDNDRDGYPFPNDTAQNLACVGPAVVVSTRTYYSNGSGGWYLAKSDCIGRSGNNCPIIDCYDSNANAFPGQTSYFTSSRGDGSYDYDCSSTTTANTGANYCSATAAGTQTYTDGTCVTPSSVVTLCTPAALSLPGACGRPLVGGSVFYVNSTPACVSGNQTSATSVGCH